MGIFKGSGIGDVDGLNKNRKFTPGEYRIEVQKLFTKPSKKERGINYLILEATVIESSGEEALEAGKPVSQALKLSSEPAWRNAKNMIAAVLGIEDDELTDELADEAVENDGAAIVGQVVDAYAERNDRGYIDIVYTATT